MDGFYLALGVTILLPFLQWAFPTIPKAVAYAGATGGILVLLSEFLDTSMKPPFAAAMLFLLGVLCFAGAGHLYLRFLKKPQASTVSSDKPTASPPTPAAALASTLRGPTLEAIGNSKIDATGAIIPGDLPFQFGKAADHSIIDMAGTTVTRQADGSILVMPGAIPVSRAFSAPTGEFSSFSDARLRERETAIAVGLRELQTRYDAEIQSLPKLPLDRRREMERLYKPVLDKYWTEYSAKLLDPAVSVASEMMSRIEAATPGTRFQHPGAMLLYHRAFAGVGPALLVADFLDGLAATLSAKEAKKAER
ncbi:hypothetical protein [Bradyrhizobium sp.]|uniref:hypothetical protein n=1 Tax=Bradyrhizobium sp. TaxID=376 RepID=UPI001EC32DDD|nr:hypothetical protein [Bradyrhizobium sp.]MBV9985459.1 hypothetical protein [Bradyrhizobium sp.]